MICQHGERVLKPTPTSARSFISDQCERTVIAEKLHATFQQSRREMQTGDSAHKLRVKWQTNVGVGLLSPLRCFQVVNGVFPARDVLDVLFEQIGSCLSVCFLLLPLFDLLAG